MALPRSVAQVLICALIALGSLLLSRYSEQQATGDAPAGKQDPGTITLRVTVIDEKQRLVSDLKSGDFSVYEDGQPQQILASRHEDLAASLGIVVDNSGSMREKRQKVTRAVVNLVRNGNPDDEVFVVNFNDDSYLDQDFTRDVSLIHKALDRLDSRGGTALYDAVIASADHLAKAAKLEKRVLLVITDGADNESRDSLEQTIRSAQNNGVAVYTIGILGSEDRMRRARRALEALAVQTGGLAFFPRNLDEVDTACRDVGASIRHQYSLTYKPINPLINGGYRRINVLARSPGHQDLMVRTTPGYFAGQQQATK